MIVDPVMLAALAQSLTEHAIRIRFACQTHSHRWRALSRLPDALPGSAVAAMSTDTSTVLADVCDILSGPIDQMAYISGKGSADYTITVEDFAARIRATGELL